ncbi:hypothetical protein, variant [Aphanomyces astaci]|uniref:Uncharacterized protein n=1 Tax=Aphanomyces astaci TaxID=112090 RepID=W4G559_APHAT|nr:hypothetical protein, variant [Aphanomyces astaci]ETV74164.1 hypothetical protein, variant [Aphanomyces astaci]|eukprot:XP_009836269.1 hypothetical protein, variant [Aphanomyces astaci]
MAANPMPPQSSTPQDFFGGGSTLFMDEVFKAVESYVDDGSMSLEHKLLESHGGPSMTSTQAQHIHEGVSQYMDAVRTAFVKNFDKFELYMLRNVFVAPENIDEIRTAAHTHDREQSTDVDLSNDANPDDVDAELHALRQDIYAATQKQAALLAAKSELDQQVSGIHQLAVDLRFTQDIPKIAGPLGEHVKSAVALREAIGTMKGLQLHLNSKARVNEQPRPSPIVSYESVISRFHKQPMQVPLSDLVRVNQLLGRR